MDYADYIKLNNQVNAYRQEVVKRAVGWIRENIQRVTVDNTLKDPNAYCIRIPRAIIVDRGIFRLRLTHNSNGGTVMIRFPASLLVGIDLASEDEAPVEPDTSFPARALTGLLREAGFEVLVQQTGGNTATIYATRGGITVIGGPGEYCWTAPEDSYFDTGDFYVGIEDPDDGGKRVTPGASMVAIAALFGSEAGAAS